MAKPVNAQVSTKHHYAVEKIRLFLQSVKKNWNADSTFLVLLFVLSLAIRLWGISTPPLNQDEALYAYDSYSIGTTLHDQWGVLLPARPECFGEYCSPALTYIAAPFSAILGPTELAIRLPVAILNSLLPLAVALFLLRTTKSRLAAFSAGLLMALNPAMIISSRIGFSTFLVQVFSTLALLVAATCRLSNRNMAICAALAALAFYSYSTAAPFILLVMLPVIFIRSITDAGRGIIKVLKPSIVFGTMLFVLVLPSLVFMFQHPSYDAFRRDQVTIFNPDSPLNANHEQWLSILPRHYVSYFGWSYLSAPYSSEVPNAQFLSELLALLAIIGLLAAVASIVKNKRDVLGYAVLLWFLFGFLPAALTFYSPQSYRAATWFPVFFAAAGLGIYAVSKKSKAAAIALAVLALGFEAAAIMPMQQSWNCAPLFASGAGWAQAAQSYSQSQTWQLLGHPVYIYSFAYQARDPNEVQSVLSATNRSRPNWFNLDSIGEMAFCSDSSCNAKGDWLITSERIPNPQERISWCGRDVLYVKKLTG
ncbi:MAG: hypothetical protein WC408_04610 [Candidatus Micrarchaeia archaeon]|jgi:4-amino-4-deoxy-L-arabinose transferase-like glycosyltransferase